MGRVDGAGDSKVFGGLVSLGVFCYSSEGRRGHLVAVVVVYRFQSPVLVGVVAGGSVRIRQR